MKGLYRILISVIIVFCSSMGSAQDYRRYALIIGNENYTPGRLSNAIDDAKLVAKTIENLGFSVEVHTDLSKRGMMDAFDSFAARLRNPSSVGFFYYAGHAMQLDGRNYLIPTGLTINNEADVKYDAVDSGALLALLHAAENTVNIVILDACRNNPFRAFSRSLNPGLASTIAPPGAVVAYSTSPGDIASDDRTYAKSLSKYLFSPGLTIESVMRSVAAEVRQLSRGEQVPWYQSSLTTEVMLMGSLSANEVDPLPLDSGRTQPPRVRLAMVVHRSLGADSLADLDRATICRPPSRTYAVPLSEIERRNNIKFSIEYTFEIFELGQRFRSKVCDALIIDQYLITAVLPESSGEEYKILPVSE